MQSLLRNLIFVGAFLASAYVGAAPAALSRAVPPDSGFTAGMAVNVAASCVGLADAIAMAELIGAGRPDWRSEYQAAMRDPETDCSDVRVSGGMETPALLLTWEGSVAGAAGRFEVWRVLDLPRHRILHTWVSGKPPRPLPALAGEEI